MSPAWLLRRLLLMAYTMLVVSLLVFAITQVLPADAAVSLLGENATPAALVDHAQKTGASELAVPRKIVKIPQVPVLGTGKTDYVAIQKIAETELARAA